MQKFLINILVAFFIVCIFAPGLVSAQIDYGQNEDGLLRNVAMDSGYTTGNEEFQLSQRAGQIVGIALGFVGMIFFILTVYAGFLWMTASGNEERVSKAKEILTTSVIGLIIALAAYSITFFVTSRLTSSSGVIYNPATVGSTNPCGEGRELMYQGDLWTDDVVDWFDGFFSSGCSGSGQDRVCCMEID